MAKTQETFVIQVFQSDVEPASFANVQVGMRKARARGGTSTPGAAGWASAIGESGVMEGCVVEMEVGLPTDNWEKKGKGIGIWGIEAAQSRSGGKKQEEQDSCYENQAVKRLTGLSLRNCPAVTGVFR